MSEYIPRLTAPPYRSLRWVKTDSGGYNQCIYGSDGPPEVIPNCTGYVHGRWMELANINTDNLGLSFGNAITYYSNSSSDLQRGQEPQLGACICFGGTEAGHVAIVEEIIDENTIRCSESDWGGQRFSVRVRRREWNWKFYQGELISFQGFLYHPNIQPTPIGGGNFKWWMARKLLLKRKGEI